MARILLSALALAASICLWGQERPIPPLNLPMSFSGTYGELRHNHFHQGLDWRVGGKVGDPIHAIKSGFVSRVSVSVTGYGNAVYIDHPDGTTSVYGHMLEFMPSLAARVKAEQYARESFSVDLAFKEDEFPLKQGDIIGKVGNTGSSAGPHLHMEVRDTKSETPLNYISKGYYTPQDNLRPVFKRVAFYGFDTLAIGNPYRVRMLTRPLSYKGVIELPPVSYVAIDAYDTQNGTSGKLAVEVYKVILDDEEIFSYKVGDVGFEESPYIKSLVQAGETGTDFVKSSVDPANLLTDRMSFKDNGLIRLEDDSVHKLRLEAFDEHGNASTLSFSVRRSASISAPARDTSIMSLACLWYIPNRIETEEFSYLIPVASLYRSANVYYRKVASASVERGIYSDVWEIFSPMAAMREGGILSFKCDIPDELKDKAFIASYNNGRLSIAAKRPGFGTYCLAVDTGAPQINVDRGGRIRVKDDRAGVKDVRVEIDGKWHLSKYSGTTVTILDRGGIRRGSHKVRITATDYCNNESFVETTISF